MIKSNAEVLKYTLFAFSFTYFGKSKKILEKKETFDFFKFEGFLIIKVKKII